jgi:hypothetical protein
MSTTDSISWITKVRVKLTSLKKTSIPVLGLFIALGAGRAFATEINLASAGASATQVAAVGGTFIVDQISPSATGSGVIDPFYRINPGGGQTQEAGYNTDSPVLDDNSSPTFTHSLTLGQVPIVVIGGVAYRQFMLDINQTNANPDLSLNQIQFFTGTNASPSSTGTPCDSLAVSCTTPPVVNITGATQVFEMSSAGTPWTIHLDYSLNHGSGSGDMFLYVNSALFGSDPNKYVTMFSQFGSPGPNAANDGYEEWAILRADAPPVPEPTSIGLFGMGLLTAGFALRKRLAARR